MSLKSGVLKSDLTDTPVWQGYKVGCNMAGWFSEKVGGGAAPFPGITKQGHVWEPFCVIFISFSDSF